jgi:hypothetical protein
MERREAEKILSLMLEQSGICSEAGFILQNGVQTEETVKLKKALAAILFDIYNNILMPIYTTYPDLYPFAQVKRIECLRITSPDYKTDAVIVKLDIPEPARGFYELYLTPKDRDIEIGIPRLKVDVITGMEVKWENRRLLRVAYRTGRIWGFSNKWHADEREDLKSNVAILLDGPTG